MAGAAALNRVAERRPGPTADNFQPLPSEADERLATETQAADDVVAQEELRLKNIERLRKEKTGQGESGGVPIAIAVGEVTSSEKLSDKTEAKKAIEKAKRAAKKEEKKAAAEKAAEQASDPQQRTMETFFTPRLATPTGISVSRSPKAVSLQNMVSAFRQSPK
jgi:septal ring factor EnvC (AmiA/AmiB activator)